MIRHGSLSYSLWATKILLNKKEKYLKELFSEESDAKSIVMKQTTKNEIKILIFDFDETSVNVFLEYWDLDETKMRKKHMCDSFKKTDTLWRDKASGLAIVKMRNGWTLYSSIIHPLSENSETRIETIYK